MANIRDLKKDINFVLGDIIEAVFLWESATKNKNSKEGSAIIDNAIKIFDTLIEKVNQKNVENKKQHFNGIRAELEKEATALIEKLNGLTA
ncbi:hypothetical protein [Spongiimicrobium salis]|uniref:hypothetical protein n=1 Tax=Spongiimicrobium salis TaxID=1667022 RepID=UPI00374D6741